MWLHLRQVLKIKCLNYSNDKVLVYCCYEEVIVRDSYAKGVKYTGLDCETFIHVLECLQAPKPLDYLYILLTYGLHCGYFQRMGKKSYFV